MKYSIIVVAYNEEDRLKKCLDSIVNQTYKDFELLLINDGSTDSTLSIMEYFSLKHNKTRVISKENTGQADCKNIGINESVGEYLLFVDGDDFIEVNLLERMNEILQDNTINLIIFKFNMYFENKKKYMDINKKFDNSIQNSKDMLSKYFSNKSGPLGRNMLINRKILIDNNIAFPLRTREDGGTIYKIIYYSKKIFLSKELLYNYVRHMDSTVHTFNHNNCIDAVKNLEEISIFLREKNIDNKLMKEFENYRFSALISEYRHLIFNYLIIDNEICSNLMNIIRNEINYINYKELSQKNKIKFLTFKNGMLKYFYLFKSRVKI